MRGQTLSWCYGNAEAPAVTSTECPLYPRSCVTTASHCITCRDRNKDKKGLRLEPCRDLGAGADCTLATMNESASSWEMQAGSHARDPHVCTLAPSQGTDSSLRLGIIIIISKTTETVHLQKVKSRQNLLVCLFFSERVCFQYSKNRHT